MSKVYGLLGYPLGHSFSKRFFTDKFESLGVDATFRNFEFPDVKMMLESVANEPDLAGFAITIPHKQAIIPYIDQLHHSAKKIGAVNSVKVDWIDGKPFLTGYNTDYNGFIESIKPHIKPSHKRALVLGTGGASKAVIAALVDLGLECQYVSRNSSEKAIAYDTLFEDGSFMSSHQVVVNCSPVGTFPNNDTCPNIPYEMLTDSHLLFDLVYNPAETLFLKKGKERGATVANGAMMLEIQADASWVYWNE